MTAPLASKMGDTVSEMGTSRPPRPFLTVSKWSTRRPARIEASTVSSSDCRSSGMMRRIDEPIISSAVYPNMRSAASFHDSTFPFKILTDDRIIRGLDDSCQTPGYGIRRVGH